MTESFKTRYYTIPASEVMGTDALAALLRSNRDKGDEKEGSLSDLKVAADGEIYLADNAPDFLFEKYDRMMSGIFDDEEKQEEKSFSSLQKSSSSLHKSFNNSLHKSSSSLHKSASSLHKSSSSLNSKSTKKKGKKSSKSKKIDDDDDGDEDQGFSNVAMPKCKSIAEKSRAKFRSQRQLQRTASERMMKQKELEKQRQEDEEEQEEEDDDASEDEERRHRHLKKSPSIRSHHRKESSHKSLKDASSHSLSKSSKHILSHHSSSHHNSKHKDNRHNDESSEEDDEDDNESETDRNCPMFKLINLDPSKAMEKVEEEELVALIKKDPNLCSKTYQFDAFAKDKIYPLHMICAMGASLHTVKKCYKAYPEAINYHSSYKGNTVLHYAVMYMRASIEVLQFLLYKEPDAYKALNKKQQTPLHLACMVSCTFRLYNADVILLLTEVGPECTTQVDYHGRTPLLIACKVDQPCLKIIEDLTEVGPKACKMQCHHAKYTPLHFACESKHVSNEENQVVDVIKDLLRSDPSVTKIPNEKGKLPIFIAVENKACLKIISALVRKYPDCLECTNEEGLNPHDVAKSLQLDQDIVDFLYPYEED